MTDEQLAAIEAREKSATEGPWTVGTVGEADGRIHPTIERPSYPEKTYPWDQRLWTDEDWQFVAHARQDIPDLLAEVKRLRIEAINARTGGADEERRRWYIAVDRDGKGLVSEGLAPEIVIERLRGALDAARGALADIAHMTPNEVRAGVAQKKADRIYRETDLT